MEGEKKHHFPLALYSRSHHPSLALLACLARLRLRNSRFFSLKINKEIGKACRKSLTRAKRASITRPSISLSLREASREPGERN